MADPPSSLQWPSTNKSALSPWHSSRAMSVNGVGAHWQPARRRPAHPSDLSASLVTASSGSDSASQNSAPSPAGSPGAVCADPAPPLSRRWLDEFESDDAFYDEELRGPPLSLQLVHPRALPRTGVVSFRKEGDSLRWAPRVTQNTGGVAARVHNFEDAFTLEEFSSRALPVVWNSTGGNPRLSSATEEDLSSSHANHSLAALKGGRASPSGSPSAGNGEPASAENPGSESDDLPASGSERKIVRNASYKRAVALATDLRRPPFWSLFSYNDKYRKIKAQNRQRAKADQSKREATGDTSMSVIGLAPQRSKPLSRREKKAYAAQATKRSPSKRTEKSRSMSRASKRSNANAPKRSGETSTAKESVVRSEKKVSVFRKLFGRFDRQPGKDVTPVEMVTSSSDSSDCSGRSMDSEEPVAEKNFDAVRRSKSVWRLGRPSEESRVRIDGSSRRVRSALSGSARRSGSGETRVPMYDDQYVTFITSGEGEKL